MKQFPIRHVGRKKRPPDAASARTVDHKARHQATIALRREEAKAHQILIFTRSHA